MTTALSAGVASNRIGIFQAMAIVIKLAGLRKHFAPFKAKALAPQQAEMPVVAEACRAQPNFVFWLTMSLIAALAFIVMLVEYRRKKLKKDKKTAKNKKKQPTSSTSSDVTASSSSEAESAIKQKAKDKERARKAIAKTKEK